ncbi:MAG: DNA methyltransferase [Deltaproteobacteria bacterium]|nr:MAG: DNA methyltransferase [Deltaproteobacteria bacterium]
MIKYIGSKRRLVDDIVRIFAAFPHVRSVGDLFSGTSRVGLAAKRAGFRVVANDHNAYAHTLAVCHVEADAEDVGEPARRELRRLSELPPTPGPFTRTYCEEARFFHPTNGARIEAIRNAIEAADHPRPLRQVLLAALVEAADRVDSTCGVQMAYLKSWAPRALRPLELRVPELAPRPAHGPCTALELDAEEAVRHMDVDVLYVDPPYNQHSYLANYHVWETLVRWDEPEVYGKARKRADCKVRKSPFNRKDTCRKALARVIEGARAEVIVLSFNDEGFLSRDEIEALLRPRGPLAVLVREGPRYIGARIGIYDPRGRKVGTPGRLRNREFLYVSCTSRRLADATDLPFA